MMKIKILLIVLISSIFIGCNSDPKETNSEVDSDNNISNIPIGQKDSIMMKSDPVIFDSVKMQPHTYKSENGEIIDVDYMNYEGRQFMSIKRKDKPDLILSLKKDISKEKIYATSTHKWIVNQNKATFYSEKDTIVFFEQ